MDSLLEVRDLDFSYPVGNFFFGTKQNENGKVLRNIGLTVNTGESFSLIGESGSGKTTLAKVILGLYRPTRGKVLIKGRDLFALSPKELKKQRRAFQMIFQDPYSSLNPRMNVSELVSEPLRFFRSDMRTAEVGKEVRRVLNDVGLGSSDAGKFPHQFSGGQRQRVAIARALIAKPSFIVADEPLSALDLSVRAQIVNLLLDLREEHGLTYFFISHDLEIVRFLSENLAVIREGQIVESGSTAKIFKAPLHPYTQELLDSSLSCNTTHNDWEPRS